MVTADTFRPRIHERLASIIRASGLSLRNVAALAAMPPETLRRYIARGDMPVSAFLTIARALRLDPAAILTEPAENVTEARRLADLLAPLSDAERYALRALVESAVELRTAAVQADRLRGGARQLRTSTDRLDATPQSDDETPVPKRRRGD